MTSYVERVWADEVEPALAEYIRIPNVSPAYDPDWQVRGHMTRAVELVRGWCERRHIRGMSVEVLEIAGRTPMILIDVPAYGDAHRSDMVLLYGHLDKQPEMTGWREHLGPWTPVFEGERLYGRGGADDGYSAFASLVAIEAAQSEGWPHARCVILIEASEESGSPDLPAHLAGITDRITDPSLVVCLDSGCMDYERMWFTTSLRGLVGGALRVDVLDEGVHSGNASGVVPSSFRIMRTLLDRVEDSATGRILLDELHVPIPADRRAAAESAAHEFRLADQFPLTAGLSPVSADPTEQLLARTWQPTLSVTGAEGIPPISSAGNVLRPHTSLQLSFRLPPTCDHVAVLAAIESRLTSDPPYGARVQFIGGHTAPGWNAPSLEPWLETALESASRTAFGQPSRSFGEGGTIPFMGMLGAAYPAAQFVVTGVLGPGSNAHGPNEFLHLPTARRLTAALAMVLRDHARRQA